MFLNEKEINDFLECNIQEKFFLLENKKKFGITTIKKHANEFAYEVFSEAKRNGVNVLNLIKELEINEDIPTITSLDYFYETRNIYKKLFNFCKKDTINVLKKINERKEKIHIFLGEIGIQRLSINKTKITHNSFISLFNIKKEDVYQKIKKNFYKESVNKLLENKISIKTILNKLDTQEKIQKTKEKNNNLKKNVLDIFSNFLETKKFKMEENDTFISFFKTKIKESKEEFTLLIKRQTKRYKKIIDYLFAETYETEIFIDYIKNKELKETCYSRRTSFNNTFLFIFLKIASENEVKINILDLISYLKKVFVVNYKFSQDKIINSIDSFCITTEKTKSLENFSEDFDIIRKTKEINEIGEKTKCCLRINGGASHLIIPIISNSLACLLYKNINGKDVGMYTWEFLEKKKDVFTKTLVIDNIEASEKLDIEETKYLLSLILKQKRNYNKILLGTIRNDISLDVVKDIKIEKRNTKLVAFRGDSSDSKKCFVLFESSEINFKDVKIEKADKVSDFFYLQAMEEIQYERKYHDSLNRFAHKENESFIIKNNNTFLGYFVSSKVFYNGVISKKTKIDETVSKFEGIETKTALYINDLMLTDNFNSKKFLPYIIKHMVKYCEENNIKDIVANTINEKSKKLLEKITKLGFNVYEENLFNFSQYEKLNKETEEKCSYITEKIAI